MPQRPHDLPPPPAPPAGGLLGLAEPIASPAAGAIEPTDARHPVLRVAVASVLLLLAALLAWLGGDLATRADAAAVVHGVLGSEAFWWALAVGLLAQAVDGALGMAYGITASSFLIAGGASPLVASASVHLAEVFTTGASGVAHARLGNVDRRLFLRLLLPGVAGATAGALLLAHVDGDALKPWIAAYLALMGAVVLARAWRRSRPAPRREPRHVAALGLGGGFVDAVGGGGWGPVVTSTLLGSGRDPRTTIGSVNLAEFFLTFASAGVFALVVDTLPWPTIAGLVAGGLLAAPLAALLTRRLPLRLLLALVGTAIVAVSLVNLARAL